MDCREGVKEPSRPEDFGNGLDNIRNDAGKAHPAPGRGVGLSDLWISLPLPVPAVCGILGALGALHPGKTLLHAGLQVQGRHNPPGHRDVGMEQIHDPTGGLCLARCSRGRGIPEGMKGSLIQWIPAPRDLPNPNHPHIPSTPSVPFFMGTTANLEGKNPCSVKPLDFCGVFFVFHGVSRDFFPCLNSLFTVFINKFLHFCFRRSGSGEEPAG